MELTTVHGKSWKEICQNVNSGGKIHGDFFLCFSVYSTVLCQFRPVRTMTWKAGKQERIQVFLYLNEEARAVGVTPATLAAMLCAQEVSGAQAGVEAVTQALQQPHSWGNNSLLF